MRNLFKKVFAGTAAGMLLFSMVPTVLVSTVAAADADAVEAWTWLSENGLTTTTNADMFNGPAGITRAEFATFAARFAKKFTDKVADSSLDCDFADLGPDYDPNLTEGVKAACEMKIMGVGVGEYFNPNAAISRAETATVLDRLLPGGDERNTTTPNFYYEHMEYLNNAGVISNTNPNLMDTRSNIGLMLKRLVTKGLVGEDAVDCESMEVMLACTMSELGEDSMGSCPAQCADYYNDTESCDDGFMYDEDTETCVEVPSCEDGYVYDSASDECVLEVFEEDKKGTLEVSLSFDTPTPEVGEVVPGATVGVHVSSFDFCAAGSDVTLREVNLERNLGETETLEGVALRVEDGDRITDVKNEKTDGTVDLRINGGMVIKAGSCETLKVIVNVNNAYNTDGTDLAAGDTFRFRVLGVDSSAETLNNDKTLSKIHTVATEDGTTYTMTEDTAISDVKVGENGVIIAQFELENMDSEDSLYLKSIMFENIGSADLEEAANNFQLYIEGTLYAEDGQANGDYITFVGNYEVPDGETVDMEVKADIAGEINESILLTVEDELDVTVMDKNGYGAASENFSAEVIGTNGVIENKNYVNYVVIDAGAVYLDEIEGTDEIQVDKDDQILAMFTVFVNEGSDLYTEDVLLDVEVDYPSACGTEPTISAVLEDIELKNMTTSSTMSLTRVGSASATSEQYKYDSREDFRAGKNVMYIYADVPNLTDAQRDCFDGAEFTLSFNDIETQGMTFKEDSDDQPVTDVTPNTLTFNTVQGVLSSFDVSIASMDNGINYDVVRGTEKVPAMVMDIKAGSNSDISISDLTLSGYLGGGSISIDDSPNTISRTYHLAIGDNDGIVGNGYTQAFSYNYSISLGGDVTLNRMLTHGADGYSFTSPETLRDEIYRHMDSTDGLTNAKMIDSDDNVYNISKLSGVDCLVPGGAEIGGDIYCVKVQADFDFNATASLNDGGAKDGFMAFDPNGSTVTTYTQYLDIEHNVGAKFDANIYFDANDDGDYSDAGETALAFINDGDLSSLSAALSAFGADGANVLTVGGHSIVIDHDTKKLYSDRPFEITFSDVDPGTITQKITDDYISRVNLYLAENMDEVNADNLVATTSDIEDGVITFKDLDGELGMDIAKTETHRFIVTFDLVDDVNNVGELVILGFRSIDADDQEGDVVIASVSDSDDGLSPWLSDRTISIQDFGKVYLTTDNTDTETRNDKNILGGDFESPIIASFEIRAENEEITVEDVEFKFSSSTIGSSVVKVIVYDEDKVSVIDTQTVSNSDVVFIEDFNHKVKGTKNIYVALETKKQGKQTLSSNQGLEYPDGTIQMRITKAKGQRNVVLNYTSNPSVYLNNGGVSKLFHILPVNLSTIELYKGDVTSVVPGLSQKVGYLKVTSDGSLNNRSQKEIPADLVLRQVGIKVEGITNLSALKLRKVGSSNPDILIATEVGSNGIVDPSVETYEDKNSTTDVDLLLNTRKTENNVVVPLGETVTYEIIATVGAAAAGVSVSLDTSNIKFSTNEDNANDGTYDKPIGTAYTVANSSTLSYTVSVNN